MKKFTGFQGDRKIRANNQLGINMVGLIVWAFLAVIVMGGVGALFVTTSQQTAVGAEQGQQQSSILNALNRVSRDVTMSNPIVYASDSEIVLDVKTESGSIERRRYIVDPAAKTMREYSKVVSQGDAYDPTDANNYWNANVQRNAVTVTAVDPTASVPFLTYYDSKSTQITGVISTSKNAEAIARVDVALTAGVANKGNVSLSTSAVPRSTTNLGATATSVLPTCPAFTATLEGDNVTLRWDKASSDTTSYEVTRNGVMINRVDVTDQTVLKYYYTDSPGSSGTVLNYMLKVISPAGISNCTDSIRPIVIMPGATQLTADLIPLTTVDSSGVPVSTAWSNASETTQVNLKWPKVSIASGYILYKQPLDNSGNPTGDRVLVATLDSYPYIDQNSTTTAPDNLSYAVNVGWDEQWEWTIKVLSRSGDNDQTPAIRTLSYPKPVIDVSTLAVPLAGNGDVVSSSDIAAGKGNTKITWNYSAGMEARGFDIYRSVIDQPATNFPAGFTKIGSTDAGVNQFYDRNAEFGSTYGYFVVAKNSSGFANSYASKLVQQLQFPPDPVLVPVGANGSRDNQGTNTLMWNAAKSASGYHVYRRDTVTGTMVCLSSSDCTVPSGGLSGSTLSYTDSSSAITPASQYRYGAYAYNATGNSPSLAAAVTLTQRPSAPTLNVTAIPTLSSNTTSMAWNHTAGSWCVSGSYDSSYAGNTTNCSYEELQKHNDGSTMYTGTFYGTSIDWNNQDWGRHYTYQVRARNAAVTGNGWSDYSNTTSSDTYPSPYNLNVWNGDSSGNQSQRVNYDSQVDVGGWGNVRKAGYTTAAWGTIPGASKVDVVRVHDQWQVTSGDSSLLLPQSDTISGTAYAGSSGYVTSGTWTLIASPGTTYRFDFVATSIENSLTRSMSTSNTITPADVPMAGAVQIICAGPGNGDSTGTQSWPNQIIAARTAYTNLSSRYGYFEHTAVQKLYSPYQGSGVWSNGWVGVAQGGNGDGIITSNGVGYFQNIENGFTFVNRANGRSESATLGWFDIQVIYTFSTCPPTGQPMDEPSDACYGYTYAGCTALNPDQRPRWLSR